MRKRKIDLKEFSFKHTKRNTMLGEALEFQIFLHSLSSAISDVVYLSPFFSFSL
jgi:hypothetical protein